MDKFSCTLRGYDKDEVNAFIDNIIARVENMVKEIEVKDEKISRYKAVLKKNELLMTEMTTQLETLSKTIEQPKEISLDEALERARVDSKRIVEDATIKAKKIVNQAQENADTIISECLMEAKKIEMQKNNLKEEIEKLKQKKETLYYS